MTVCLIKEKFDILISDAAIKKVSENFNEWCIYSVYPISKDYYISVLTESLKEPINLSLEDVTRDVLPHYEFHQKVICVADVLITRIAIELGKEAERRCIEDFLENLQNAFTVNLQQEMII